MEVIWKYGQKSIHFLKRTKYPENLNFTLLFSDNDKKECCLFQASKWPLKPKILLTWNISLFIIETYVGEEISRDSIRDFDF